MKKYIFLLCSLLACSLVPAQTIKTYNGRMSKEPIRLVKFGFALYKTSDNWTYQYYEDENGDRIYHGNLKYRLEFNKTWIYTVKGQYSHGKKEGLWEYKTVSDNKEIAKFVVNYHNDLLEGKFEYFVARGKNDVKRMNGKFQNGDLIGEVEYSAAGFGYSDNCTLNYKEGGYPIGTWKFNKKSSIEHNYEMRFVNGFLVYLYSIDQSTGERKNKKAEDVEIGKYDGYGETVLVPESMAKILTPQNRKFKGLNRYYEVLDVSDKDIEFAIDWVGTPIGWFHSIYSDIGYSPKYLIIKSDEVRNKEVIDSINNAKRQQEKEARIAEEKARHEEMLRKAEAQEALYNAAVANRELAQKIEQAIVVKKAEKKWENLTKLFRVVSMNHKDYETKQEDVQLLNQFYVSVYRIINSEIDNKSRKEYEAYIESDTRAAISANGRAGGWTHYCAPDSIIKKATEHSCHLNLLEMDSIPELSDQDILKHNKEAEKDEKRAERANKLLKSLLK